MRPLLALLLLAGTWGEEPAPATTTATQGTGPTAGERTTSASLAADYAWALARTQAQNEYRLRQTEAARQSHMADNTRGPQPESPTLTPGGLATLVEGDEVALLLELQRRRRHANQEPSAHQRDILADELTSALGGTPKSADAPTADTTAHPADTPHPGPVPANGVGFPPRPESLTR